MIWSFASGRQDWESTSQRGAMRIFSPDFEASPDHAGAIIHDMHTHPRVARKRPLDADTVVLYYQASLPFATEKVNHNTLGTAVFHRVVNGLLRDVVEVRCHGRVVNQYHLFTIEGACDPKEVFDFCCIQLQC